MREKNKSDVKYSKETKDLGYRRKRNSGTQREERGRARWTENKERVALIAKKVTAVFLREKVMSRRIIRPVIPEV